MTNEQKEKALVKIWNESRNFYWEETLQNKEVILDGCFDAKTLREIANVLDA